MEQRRSLITINHPNENIFFRGASTATNNDGSTIVGYYRGWPGSAAMGEGFI
ncbi:hypothetical protein OBK20_05450 [Empedobacter falsenii]